MDLDPVHHYQGSQFRFDLRAREAELDHQVLSHPVVQAQRIQVELIKQMKESAPWLLPTIIS